ncbi:hypothetical protein PRIPAC_76591 [Pristionchus pacificus]|uniref:Uncharacterized protein n=1 Tax=Pristionchus pacificus TaxID=54126 RepID=A0A2A6BRM8_PRIPA|nr:hypothetical protein PRIPAC_76591 [Pristionchus pacificus]|eukprot:PDM68574.1 hypothetical protein PRIPAC_44076 [Pristionchus pacificus]
MKYQKPSVQCHVCERFPVLSATAEIVAFSGFHCQKDGEPQQPILCSSEKGLGPVDWSSFLVIVAMAGERILLPWFPIGLLTELHQDHRGRREIEADIVNETEGQKTSSRKKVTKIGAVSPVYPITKQSEEREDD